MKKISVKVGIIVSLMLSLQLCTTKFDNEQTEIAGNRKTSVFKKFDVEGENFEVDAEKGKKITLNTGSILDIPADAFVDKNGKTIKGKVDISFREFHTLDEILASGINMRYDSAGVKYDFESAGMFQINGTQNKEAVLINKEKGIKVDLVSHKKGNFNFYQLNQNKAISKTVSITSPFISKLQAQDNKETTAPTTEKWQLLATNLEAKPNEDKKAKVKELQSQIPIKPIEPQNFDAKEPTLDFNISTTEFPELKEFEGVIWQYAGDKNAEENPSKNEWIFKEDWSNINLEAYDPSIAHYKLTLTNGGKSYTTIIKPALRGAQLEKAKTLFAKKMETYKEERSKNQDFVKKVEDELSKVKLQGDFRRAFTILIFGTHNWDKNFDFGGTNSNSISADFNIKGASKEDIIYVYLLVGNRTGCINYEKLRWKNFKYSKSESNQIIAVLKNDRVATFSKSKFENAKNKDFKDKSDFTFELELQSEVTSLKDLKALMNAN